MGETPQKENEEIDIGRRHKAHRLYGKHLMYCTISRAFIDIPGIIVFDSPLKFRAYTIPFSAFLREIALRDGVSKAGNIISN